MMNGMTQPPAANTVKHKETSLREPEYTEPRKYSAPDTVLAGIYGNFSQYGDH